MQHLRCETGPLITVGICDPTNQMMFFVVTIFNFTLALPFAQLDPRVEVRSFIQAMITFGAMIYIMICVTSGWDLEYRIQPDFRINPDGSVTFWPTGDLETSTEPLPTAKISNSFSMKFAKLEASSDPTVKVVQFLDRDYSGISSFILSPLVAWSNHYPIRFKPEHIWLTILQGAAIHIDQNAGELRDKYVNHEGKMKLVVRRDEFILGSDQNDWEGVIEEFVDQIDANTVNDTVQLLDCDFSRSTLMEKICTKVTIMDICKNYFVYEVMTLCGFPQITLDGTKEDWIQLKQKTSVLLKTKVDEKFGVEWAKALLPLLDRFIRAFDGEIDGLFWNSMIKRGAYTGSGGFDYFSGWFNILFPFMGTTKRNHYCVPYSTDKAYVQQGLDALRTSDSWEMEAGGAVNKYPSGLSQAPVTWNYHGIELDMKFVAGFIGFQQNSKTLEIVPNLGWLIAHRMRIILQPINAFSKMKEQTHFNHSTKANVVAVHKRRWW